MKLSAPSLKLLSVRKKINKLWEEIELDEEIETFETKEDLVLDQKLVKYDVEGSIAHAKMLAKIGILTHEELNKLQKGLLEIVKLDKQKKFELELGDEDIHTKIENYLTENYGEVGKKIHTGRSRNDQVLTAIRLLSKESLKQIEKELIVLTNEFSSFASKFGEIKMPGYTHMQKAMPSSIKIWSESFKEALEDDLVVLKNACKINDQSPLGSAAGYGTPIDLDRKYTAKLLGFSKVQNNPLYCQNSKGKIEGAILASLIQILLTINRFASDVMLFTTAEFNFFEVSKSLITGSSIMPNKKNVDIAELLRSKVHLILGNYVQIMSLTSNLISGYNRDSQDIKKSLIESFEITLDSLKTAKILLKGITPNKNSLEGALTEEIFAAQKTFELVKKGFTFRDAYKKVSSELFSRKGGESNAK